MMNSASWCVKNSRITIAVFVLISIFGIKSFFSISRLEDPEFTLRTAIVITKFPGASSHKVESLVTKKLEDAIAELGEVEHITSQSLDNVSIINVDLFEKYRNVTPIWQKLRNKLSDVSHILPEGASQPFVNDSFGDVFGIVLAITQTDRYTEELQKVAEELRDRLFESEFVSKVSLHGKQNETIFIHFSEGRLAKYSYTPYAVADFLNKQNALSPSGSGLIGKENINLETTGEFTRFSQLKDNSLRIPGVTEALTLSDTAQVIKGFQDPPESLVRFNGKPAVALAISMRPGGNLVDLGYEVEKISSSLKEQLSNPVNIDKMIFQPKFVERSIGEVTKQLLAAIGFVLSVMFLFTGIHTGLIVGSLVPMAMLSCLALMPILNVTLHRISIAALIIVLGLLVDNGVVVSENILVRLLRGEKRLSAIQEATKHLALPLFISSLTTVFAFLPIFLAQSGVGEYTLSIFIVVATTSIASWMLSMTFIPFLCYYFLKPKKQSETYLQPIYNLYHKLLRISLSHKKATLLLTVFLFSSSLFFFRYIPNIFFPPNEREMFVIELWQPFGWDITSNAKEVKKLEDFLKTQDRIDSFSSFIGDGGPRWYLSLRPKQRYPNYAFLVVNSKNPQDNAPLSQRISSFIQKNLPDSRYNIKQLEQGPPIGAPIQIRIRGNEMHTLYSLFDKLETIISPLKGVHNIQNDWGEWSKLISIDVKQEEAKIAGISSKEIALSLQTQISGYKATEYRKENDTIPIVLRSNEAGENMRRLQDLMVFSLRNFNPLPLSHLADLRLTWKPSNIRHRDSIRTLTFKADLQQRLASDAMKEIKQKLQHLLSNLPKGYTLEFGGEEETSKKAKNSIRKGLPLSFSLLFFALLFEFNSFRCVLIILLTVPLILIGITPGLLITSSPFGFMALLGMISLAGIVVNNAIMMIDSIKIEEKKRGKINASLIEGAQNRLRPILATALTTIVGLLPLSLYGGEFWRPMANTLIFGLLFSTLLTLFICPILYSIFFRVRPS